MTPIYYKLKMFEEALENMNETYKQ